MQLDKSNYESLIENIKNIFYEVFACDMTFLGESNSTDYMGAFSLRYLYKPLEFTILFESERKRFEVRIINKQGASNQLFRIAKFNPELSLENAKYAIEELKQVLVEKNLDFYFSQGNKIYKISGNETKRVRDISSITIQRDDCDK